jgi:hypothetical protein
MNSFEDLLNGMSADLANCVRALATGSSFDPMIAMEELEMMLGVQGDAQIIYESCIQVIPALLFVLKSPQRDRRKIMVELLYHIGHAAGFFIEKKQDAVAQNLLGPDLYAKKHTQEQEKMRRLQSAYQEGADCFLELLGDPVPEVRGPCASLLGSLPEFKTNSLPKLRQMTTSDPDQEVRSSAEKAIQALTV